MIETKMESIVLYSQREIKMLRLVCSYLWLRFLGLDLILSRTILTRTRYCEGFSLLVEASVHAGEKQGLAREFTVDPFTLRRMMTRLAAKPVISPYHGGLINSFCLGPPLLSPIPWPSGKRTIRRETNSTSSHEGPILTPDFSLQQIIVYVKG